MTSSTAYTELESLLLFQALRAEDLAGITPTTFNRISEQLKQVPLIRNDPKYDGGRLSPDTLRVSYLDLLKQEVKQDIERQAHEESHLTNGHGSATSRKRKAPSPSLPTVREALQHSHLIPQLVARLYSRYRQVSVSRLQSYEKDYAKVKQDIVDIEAGRRDDVLRSEKASSQLSEPKPLSVNPTGQAVLPGDRESMVRTATTPETSQKLGEDRIQDESKRFSQAKIDAVINHEPESQRSHNAHRRIPSNSTLPSLAELAHHSPQFGGASQVPGSVPLNIQQLPYASNDGYHHSPPAGHHSPYSPHHRHSRPGSISSPQVQLPISRPLSSPRPILPPPKGMHLPGASNPLTGSPVSHAPPALQPQPYHPHQQHISHRSLSGPYDNANGTSRLYQNTPLPAQAGGYYQQQVPYVDRAGSYPTQNLHPTPTYPNPAPHSGGYMLPPFSMQSPAPSQQTRPQQTPGQPPRPSHFNVPVYGGSFTGPRNVLSHTSRLVSDVVAALATPPRPKIKPLWKNDYPMHVMPTPKPRPEIEPLSPTMGRTKSPSRSTRNTNRINDDALEQQPLAETSNKGRTRRRKTNAREKSPHSVVSSVADESLRTRTRSHSVSTAAGAVPLSDDRPSSRNGVKPEPSTPANMLDESDIKTVPPSTLASGMVTRKRRGTIQSQPPPAKRTRHGSPAMSTNDQRLLPTPPPRSSTILATRNFGRTSSAMMDDITSHKHASYFAKEVREKDAPGYSDIVRYPQNLKSIRSAITAGARAIAAASSNVDSPSGNPTTSSSTVELERAADLIPPKAIVNSAQLEKELMRMFANAYLFNPGEDGMALSTKEMAQDVEEKLSEWRGTKRDVGRDATVDEEEEVKGKRRKL